MSVDKVKWEKAKSIVQELLDKFEEKDADGQVWFEFKKLEQARGFLIHLGIPYPDIIPYLKGVHLTIDSWRDNRNKRGWKVNSEREWMEMVEELGGDLEMKVGSNGKNPDVEIIMRITSCGERGT